MEEPVALAYAPPPKPRLLKQLIRMIVITTVILIVLWGSTMSYQWFESRLQIRQWETKCQQFSAPAGTIIYGEDKVVDTMTDVPQYDAGSSRTLQRDHSDDRRHQIKYLALDAAEQLAFRIGKPVYFGPHLYIGKRVTKSGTVRIIVVVLERGDNHFHSNILQPMVADVLVIEPDRWIGKSAVANSTLTTERLGNWPVYSTNGALTEFFAGQSDPSNTSRFTVDYSIGGNKGIIDGVLNDDSTVTLTVRSGPLVVP